MENNEQKVPFKTKLKDYIKNLFNFSQYTTKTKIYIFIFLILIVLSLILLVFWINDNTLLYRIVILFANTIHDWGYFGIILFMAVMALQGLFVPLPSEIVLFAAGMLWGWFLGAIMGIIGSMAAGLLCFYVSRKGGRPLAEKFVGKKGLDLVDDYISRHQIKAVVILRSVPIIPFDVISYASGLVDINVKQYSIGTFLGSIIRAFFWSTLGWLLLSQNELSFPLDVDSLPYDVLEAQSMVFNLILLLIFAIVGVMFVVYYIFVKRMEKKSQTNEKN